MVQLTTTYDKDIGMKTYVLKGDEAYAKTTDTVLNIIEFDDTYNHRTYMRVGLEFSVYRMIGDNSSLNIILNDEILNENPIPWVEYPDEHTYDDFDYLDWDLDSKTLTWGSNEDTSSGLFLPYEYDNEFYAKFYGNKQCLKSESKHYTFNKRIPSNFDCTLEVTSSTQSYESGNVDLSVTFTCNNTVELEKTVKIFDDETLLREITCTKDVPKTVTLTGLSTGLHDIWAVFDGDSESTPTSTEYPISMGYDISVEYPSAVVTGINSTVTATVLDFFGNPVPNKATIVHKYDSGSWVNGSSIVNTGSNGIAIINDATLDGKRFRIHVGSANTGFDDINEYTTTVIYPNKIKMKWWGYNILSTGSSCTLRVYLVDSSDNQIVQKGIPFTVSQTTIDGTSTNTYYSGDDGNCLIEYVGSKKGVVDYDITSFGLTSINRRILDVIQCLESATNLEINKNVTGFTKVTNGWKFSNSASIISELQYANQRVSWDFLVLQCDTDAIINIGGLDVVCNYFDYIRVITTSNEIRIYKNNVLYDSATKTGNVTLNLQNKGISSIILDNIRVMRVSRDDW